MEPDFKNLQQRLTGHAISFRLIEETDAAFICGLRNNPQYNTHLSASAVMVEAQRDWILAYKAREAMGLEYYFLVCRKDNGQGCGVVRVYDVHDGQFTWGSWILDDTKPPKAALETAILIYRFGFDILNLTKAVFDVRRDNLHTLRFHDRFGARRTGEDDQDIFYEIPADLGRALVARHMPALT